MPAAAAVVVAVAVAVVVVVVVVVAAAVPPPLAGSATAVVTLGPVPSVHRERAGSRAGCPSSRIRRVRRSTSRLGFAYPETSDSHP